MAQLPCTSHGRARSRAVSGHGDCPHFRSLRYWGQSPSSGGGMAGADPRSALAAAEVRVALLDEGLHALLLVLGREEHGEEGRLLAQAGAEGALEGEVRRLLRVGERERALRGE